MKPVIFYVDDEPHNLAVFEAALPEEWDIHIFDKPMEALEALSKFSPWIIVSDQRMPSCSGVQFLELSRKIHPDAVRIIVTGYSDEDSMVESVRKAQIFDYIRKPWDSTELEASLKRAIEFYQVHQEKIKLIQQLKERESELQKKNEELLKVSLDLEKAHKLEMEMRTELEAWVPPYILWAIKDPTIKFPMKKNIVGITFDLINSADIHNVSINGRPLRSTVIQLFSETIIRYGGHRESHSGDSAYGHFGLLQSNTNPFDAALSVAREFRVTLRGLAQTHNIQVECGLALHLAANSMVDVHTVQINTPQGIVTQKSFDTTSPDIDLLHRIEKLAHSLPGTNILLSKEFLESLSTVPTKILSLGPFLFKGQEKQVELYIIASDLVKEEDIVRLRQESLSKEKGISLVTSRAA